MQAHGEAPPPKKRSANTYLFEFVSHAQNWMRQAYGQAPVPTPQETEEGEAEKKQVSFEGDEETAEFDTEGPQDDGMDNNSGNEGTSTQVTSVTQTY